MKARKKKFVPTVANMTAYYKSRGVKNPKKSAEIYMRGYKFAKAHSVKKREASSIFRITRITQQGTWNRHAYICLLSVQQSPPNSRYHKVTYLRDWHVTKLKKRFN